MSANEQEISDMKKGIVEFLDETVEQLGISDMGDISKPVLKKQKKDDLISIVRNSLGYLNDFMAMITDFRGAPTSMKTQLLESQQTVISLQSELLTCKNDQLEALKDSVKSTVENSVKSELVSYSSVLQNGINSSDNVINEQELKKVVQNVVQDEDRSKNLMIFGLPDEPNEDINGSVSQLLLVIGEKPRVDACRIGKKKLDNSSRPVKVTAASSTVIAQILSKAKKLKKQTKYENVYLSPDRSPEQRLKQKQLVLDLKQLAVEKPGQKHFISNGKICSVDKT